MIFSNAILTVQDAWLLWSQRVSNPSITSLAHYVTLLHYLCIPLGGERVYMCMQHPCKATVTQNVLLHRVIDSLFFISIYYAVLLFEINGFVK